jgi:hypothetical protein
MDVGAAESFMSSVILAVLGSAAAEPARHSAKLTCFMAREPVADPLSERDTRNAEFLRLWDEQLARWCVDDLMPAHQEGALLQPLAVHAYAAQRLLRHAAQSDDHRQRKAAAILAGHAAELPPDTLDELFERESERSAAAAPDGLEPHYSQSVVEDVVLAATRWCRQSSLREPAFALLRKVVERTLVGDYWSTAPYALATLCRYEAAGAEALLREFDAYTRRPPPDHPTRPTLHTERRFVEALHGSGDGLGAVESMLARQDALAGEIVLEPETQALVDSWLELARRIH